MSGSIQIRGVAVSYLQRSVVAAEKLSIDVDHVQRSLVQLVLPMTNDLRCGDGGETGDWCFGEMRGRRGCEDGQGTPSCPSLL